MPKRVDPETSMMQEESDSDDSEIEEHGSQSSRSESDEEASSSVLSKTNKQQTKEDEDETDHAGNSKHKPKKKKKTTLSFKKSDLSYMFDWDPTAARRNQTQTNNNKATGESTPLELPKSTTKLLSLDKIVEEQNNTTTTQNHGSTTVSSSSSGGATTTHSNATSTSSSTHHSSATTTTTTSSSSRNHVNPTTPAPASASSSTPVSSTSRRHSSTLKTTTESKQALPSLSTTHPEQETKPSSPRQSADYASSSSTTAVTASSLKSRRQSTEATTSSAQTQQQQQQPSAAPSNVLSKVNQEFLPLVMDNNILKVNHNPYVKLGVIGKGGSCKVYRALSKKCSVVAIKKVKIAGMDRKAIEGYANEIELLKKLQGRPAIIQMYDYQVDIARKSIFVVMELGEVDLNYVLQQQAIRAAENTSTSNNKSLSRNFIRLTWQQMLSAVHCIHEERIIHSDLKPANFLFVKGSLKLIDFGIAKSIPNDQTQNIYRDNHIGTLNYMSPEAIQADTSGTGGGSTSGNKPRMKIGRASDVWSLGCILYEMVYGTTPFAALPFLPKLQAICNPHHQIKYAETADTDAIDVMQQCLQRNPANRPPIMGGLLQHRFVMGGGGGT